MFLFPDVAVIRCSYSYRYGRLPLLVHHSCSSWLAINSLSVFNWKSHRILSFTLESYNVKQNVISLISDSLVPVKTVQLGEPATLTCAIPKELSIRGLKWYKQSVGDTLKLIVTLIQSKAVFSPGFLSSRFRINNDANFSSLIILETVQEDEGHYHCTNTEWIGTTWGGIYLLVTESNPGDTMTLQCSVFSDSDNKTCPGDLNILWVREGSDKSLPNIIYTDKNRSNEREKRSDHQKTCVYRFSKNVSSSDAGTYYCAVATCGEILFGSGTTVVIQGNVIITLLIRKNVTNGTLAFISSHLFLFFLI
uniref:Ig-like domain-containing protein n=1 Tax=Maylandia zebra TaxID=106582 RepID=A0A3P9CMZ1_9CICH